MSLSTFDAIVAVSGPTQICLRAKVQDLVRFNPTIRSGLGSVFHTKSRPSFEELIVGYGVMCCHEPTLHQRSQLRLIDA